MSITIGVDIGGTNIKIAVVSGSGRVAARGVIETYPHESARRAFADVHDAARQLAAGRPVAGIGVGCAGLVEARRGTLGASPNLPAWSGTPLRRIVQHTFGVPVIVENDATCAAFGESVARGRAGRDLVMITLGTGVGGGVVADGRVIHGVKGYAGEIGHMVIDPNGPPCRCGGRGCLEAFVGGYGIVRTARRLRARGRGGPAARERWSDARAVVDAARRGDRVARETVRLTGERLGEAVGSLMNLLNPSVVVIGGGIAASYPLLEPHVRRAVKRTAFSEAARAARIEASRLGNDAAMVGAALLARRARRERRAR